jgi:hypothetical protein
VEAAVSVVSEEAEELNLGAEALNSEVVLNSEEEKWVVLKWVVLKWGLKEEPRVVLKHQLHKEGVKLPHLKGVDRLQHFKTSNPTYSRVF